MPISNAKELTALFLLSGFTALAFGPPNANASTEPAYGKCRSEIRKTVDGWAEHPSWRGNIGVLDGSQTFRTPTSEIGAWLELTLRPDGSSELDRITPHTVTVVEWEGTYCTPRMKTEIASPATVTEAARADLLTDESLKELIGTQGVGIIYAWSPHMPYSTAGVFEAQAAAKKLGAKFIPVLDPYADLQQARGSLAKMKTDPSFFRRMGSIELKLRNMQIHYPSMLAFKDGKIIDHLMPGYRSGQKIEQTIREVQSQ